MKISIKQWFIYPVIATVIAILIANWLMDLKILSLIKEIFIKFNYLITLPLWGLILLCFSGLSVFILVRLFIIYKKKDPDWKQYTEDKIFDVNWEWECINNNVGYNIYPFCPNCGSKLEVNIENGLREYLLTCGYCGYKKYLGYDYDKFKKKVLNEIDRRVKTGEYKNR